MPAPSDLVHETTTGTGTGNLDLVNVNGKRSFNTAFSTGGTNVFDYFISHRTAAEWERGTGHMSDADTLVRDTVIASSNSNNAVNFSAGTKDVSNDIPAANQARLDATNTFTARQIIETNAGTIPSPVNTSGDLIHMVAASTVQTGIMFDAFGNNNVFRYRRANGTPGSETAVLSGESIGAHNIYGHDGTAYSGAQGQFLLVANENWTTGAKGTRLTVSLTADGGTTNAERFRVNGASTYVIATGTTASAANAVINNASSPVNELLRSTSSLRYKRDVEPIDQQHADVVLSLNPIWYRSTIPTDRQDWSWYGLSAEEVAQIDPRLVHWGYLPEDMEPVERGEGLDKYVEYRPKKDAQLVPDGVAYDRLAVLLLDVVKRLEKRVVELEANASLPRPAVR